MWNWVVNFYKSYKYVIWWTAVYFIATWAIMKFMFDFDILSAQRWHQLMHAHLRGFPGFVFGILILAAVPMYVATTIVIAKTKAPLFTIKIPEFIKNAFTQKPMDDENATPMVENVAEKTNTATTDENKPTKIPESVPGEIRAAYARAREHVGRMQTSVFDLGHTTKATPDTVAEAEPVADIPIPTDFDIDDIDNDVPQFTDINFDDDDDDQEITPDTFDSIKEVSDTVVPVIEFLKSKSCDYTIDGDVVITDSFAIVAHTDNDFWVADSDSWFAAGKTRPSPIELVMQAAKKHCVEPALYLGSKNIMDIDNLVPQWESNGIQVVTDLNDLM